MSYREDRLRSLELQVAQDRAKIRKFEKTGEPAWMANPEAMYRHKLNCYLRQAERDYLSGDAEYAP